MAKRIQPLVAFKALKHLVADPEATDKVFEIIDAMAGDATEKCHQRFLGTASGQRLAAADGSLLATLLQRDWLQSLPEGSLGRAYLHFLESEQLSADGLVEASDSAGQYSHASPGFRHFNLRLRDQHDLWHITTGYGRDVAGEASLLAFTYAQTRNRGLGLISLVGGLKLYRRFGLSIFKSLWQGYQLGKAAAWLPQQEWETLLALPLVQVRDLLQVGRPDVYFGLSAKASKTFSQVNSLENSGH